ncbi:MAG: hypothetical protein ABEH89_00820, partial [bacterium]
ALDWQGLRQAFYPDRGPILRWSGPDVTRPPDTPLWSGHRVRVDWQNRTQLFDWWGSGELFHVKHPTSPGTTNPEVTIL